MNELQVQSTIRWFIGSFGMFIAGWFASRGLATADQVMAFLNSGTVIGILTTAIMYIWSLFQHKDSAQVAAVAKLAGDPSSPVKGVVVDPTGAGRDLMDAVGSRHVVSAGTAAAATMAAGHPAA